MERVLLFSALVERAIWGLNVNLKLEELRKRLLEPMPTSGSGNSVTVYRRNLNESYANQPPLVRQPLVEAEAAESGVSTRDEIVDGGAPVEPSAEEPYTSVSNAVLNYVQQTAGSAPEEEVNETGVEYQLADAVAKVFEQTGNFQERFGELADMFAPIERASQAAIRSFEPLRSFEGQIYQLARSFEPMRSFQYQLAELAQTFAPMKGIQQQLVQLAEAFQIHLGRLSRSLEPAREFQFELLKLANAFESATELQNQFDQLAETFRAGVSSLDSSAEAEN
jgi:hypothetical protein